MTEALMAQGNEGAEVLSGLLNQHIFGPLVQEVYQRGGFIPYFAGDAFTAIFPIEHAGERIEQFLNAALSLRDILNSQGAIKTQLGSFSFNIKIGLSYGPVEWGIIGDEQVVGYFNGTAIQQSANAQKLAEAQEIIIDEALKSLCPTQIELEKNKPGYYGLKHVPESEHEVLDTYHDPADLLPEVISRFIPENILQSNLEGEFRNVVAVFISFEDNNNQFAFEKLVKTVIEQCRNFSGYFKEIDFGDKGGVLVCFFGAPISFEDIDERALEFATVLKEELHAILIHQQLQLRIGITSGLAFTGIVGGQERSQYAVVGKSVNLAARLMMEANWGEVLVDRDIQKVRFFKFNHKGDIRYKGVEGDIPTYSLVSRNESEITFNSVWIGREKELELLTEYALKVAHHHKAGVVNIHGEPGMGKSRLMAETKRKLLQLLGFNWFQCEADQILRKPFNPFHHFIRQYFNLSALNTEQAKLRRFERRWEKLLSELSTKTKAEAHPLLSELQRLRGVYLHLLGIQAHDPLWEQLDAEGRYQHTIEAYVQILLAEAFIRPTILLLEDGHWFDNSSRRVIHSLSRRMNELPLCVFITSRYQDDGTPYQLFDQQELREAEIEYIDIDLNVLDQSAIQEYASSILGGKITESFLEVLTRTTNGNPFYLEQILEYFQENQLLVVREGIWDIKDKKIRLSNSINSLLMARLDRLSSELKETVKIASVLGREFDLPVLTEVIKKGDLIKSAHGNTEQFVREQMECAEREQIWRASNELRYIFRHSLLREAAYSMQLRKQLRHLHLLIAEAIEKIYIEQIEHKYIDLAFHYEQAAVKPKTLEYLEKAARHARNNFQNYQALELYQRLEDRLRQIRKKSELIKVQYRQAGLLQVLGKWEACEAKLNEALAEVDGGESPELLGNLLVGKGYLEMQQGDYEQAKKHFQTALSLSESIEDYHNIIKIYGNLGILSLRTGNYQEAKESFLRSLEMNRYYDYPVRQPEIVANLGLTYMNLGDYDSGIQYLEEELGHATEEKDEQGRAVLLTNLGIISEEQGNIDKARTYFEEGLALSQKLGNRQLTAIALGNLGKIFQAKGDFQQAIDYFLKDLQICQDLGDKQGVAIANGLIGELRAMEGLFGPAEQYLERFRVMSEQLGYQKGLAKATNALADLNAYQQHFGKAIYYYDLAIQIARKIDNPYVLAQSLVEKTGVLIQQNHLDNTEAYLEESMTIASDLQNQELLFQIHLMNARLVAARGRVEDAQNLLIKLLNNSHSLAQNTEIYYYLHSMSAQEESYRIQALKGYQTLYSATPKFQYYQRILEINQVKV